MEEYDYMDELETEIDSYKLRIRELLEEKEILIQEIDELKEVYDSNIWWQNRFNAVERDKKEYKSRIDKAIKLLDEFKQMNDETIKRLSGKTSISGMLKNDNSIYDLVKIILTGEQTHE